MPRDEDILQLVSPALQPGMENPWGSRGRPAFLLGPPSCVFPSAGREESGGGSTSLALPNQGCQAHPWAGAGCCFIQGCSALGEGKAPA